MNRSCDVAVVGAGLAGLTAALFAARCGCSTIVVPGDQFGGELLNVVDVEDYPGILDKVAGYELCPIVQEQAEAAGAAFETGRASSIERDDAQWKLVLDGGSLLASAVVVCSGSAFKRLGVPGEERLEGRGVSHCATCDGPLLQGKRVAVVGGGDSGLREAIELSRSAGEVTLFEIAGSLSGQEVYRRRLGERGNVRVALSTQIEEIDGGQHVEALVARRLETGEVERHEVEGVFVYVGLEPTSPRLPEGIRRDEGGHLVVDPEMRTSLPGIFAAGSVRAGFSGQAVSAAGDGAAAALSAWRYLAGCHGAPDA